MSSLIPSKQLAFSAELAATIGLEEAILLQCLSEGSQLHTAEHQGDFQWFQLDSDWLLRWLPFWPEETISRVAENLRQQGIILLASPPLQECKHIRFAFNEARQPKTPQPSVQGGKTATQTHRGARPISRDWMPDENCIKLLARQGVPENFLREQVPEFVQRWLENGEARATWGNLFIKHVMYGWRHYEARKNRQLRAEEKPTWSPQSAPSREPKPMSQHWHPSADALEILQLNNGIPKAFIETVKPEFIMYWSDRGIQTNDWNSRFVLEVKKRWSVHTHEMENDTMPKPMSRDWQPSKDTIEHLQQYSGITPDLIDSAIAEFVFYWLERKDLRRSWNNVFVSYVKNKASKAQQKSTRDRSIAEDLTDTSWAD